MRLWAEGMLGVESEVYGPSDSEKNGNKTIFSTYLSDIMCCQIKQVWKDLLGIVQGQEECVFINLSLPIYKYLEIREKKLTAECAH